MFYCDIQRLKFSLMRADIFCILMWPRTTVTHRLECYSDSALCARTDSDAFISFLLWLTRPFEYGSKTLIGKLIKRRMLGNNWKTFRFKWLLMGYSLNANDLCAGMTSDILLYMWHAVRYAAEYRHATCVCVCACAIFPLPDLLVFYYSISIVTTNRGNEDKDNKSIGLICARFDMTALYICIREMRHKGWCYWNEGNVNGKTHRFLSIIISFWLQFEESCVALSCQILLYASYGCRR